MNDMNTYKGIPCRTEEIQIGDTIFSVISVQGDAAGESAEEKIRRLIMDYSAASVIKRLHETT